MQKLNTHGLMMHVGKHSRPAKERTTWASQKAIKGERAIILNGVRSAFLGEAAAVDCEIHIDWRSKHTQVSRRAFSTLLGSQKNRGCSPWLAALLHMRSVIQRHSRIKASVHGKFQMSKRKTHSAEFYKTNWFVRTS